MPLSERSRATIYQALEPVVGEEAISEMLSHFPARDVEEPVTKEFLRAELASTRAELHDAMHRQTMWLMGAMVTISGLTIGAVGLLR
jgi:hypothetical protein